MHIDEKFNELAQDTIRHAGKVKCSVQEYAEGLQQIAEELLTAADAAAGDVERLNQKDQGDDGG